MHTIYKICLDLQERVSSILLPIPQRDTARILQIRLTQGGIPHPIPEDACAVLTAKAPSGSSLPWLPCERSGDSLLCPIPGGHTAQPGLLRCQLRLYRADDESLLLTAPEFTVEITEQVCDATDDEAVAPSPNALDTLVSQTLAAADHAQTVADQLAQDAADGKFQGEKPVVGVDYFTDADIQAMESSILAKLDFAVITESVSAGGCLRLPDAAQLLHLRITGPETTARLWLSGKNLFDRSGVRAGLQGEGTELVIASAGFHYDLFTGNTGVGHAVSQSKLALLPVLPAGTYTLSYRRLTDSGYLRVEQVGEDGTVTLLNSAEDPVFTLEAPSRITLRRSISTAMTVADVQIEPGEMATEYEAYQPVREITVPTGVTVEATGLTAYSPTTVLQTARENTICLDYRANTKRYIQKLLIP